jgi:anthranilate synthase component 2
MKMTLNMNNRILLLDNYDSFTYNLLHYVEEAGDCRVDVYRNDEISLEAVDAYKQIILSPGPGLPSEAGILVPLIKKYAASKKMLGVCLGLQAMAEAFGGKLIQLEQVMHGVGRDVKVTAQHDSIFTGLPPSFMAGRYHSWVANRSTLPDCFQITAEDEYGNIMAIRHKQFDLCGVQFHPESVLTPLGKTIIKNWVNDK